MRVESLFVCLDCDAINQSVNLVWPRGSSIVGFVSFRFVSFRFVTPFVCLLFGLFV